MGDSKIVIKREKRDLLHRFNKYRINIDNKNCGTISNGEEKIFMVSPGKHSIFLEVKMDLWSWNYGNSLSVIVQENQTIRFVCGPNDVRSKGRLKENLKDTTRKAIAARLGIVGGIVGALIPGSNDKKPPEFVPPLYIIQENQKVNALRQFRKKSVKKNQSKFKFTVNKNIIATIVLVPIAIAILLSAVIISGGYGSPQLVTSPLITEMPVQTDKSGSAYYGSVGYRQKLTSGRDNDIMVLAKFSDYDNCNLWVTGRKKNNTTIESICVNSQKPEAVYLEKIIQLKPGDRTYLSFIDTTGVSVRIMPLGGSSEDSTLVALVLKKQLESLGITNIKVIYRSS